MRTQIISLALFLHVVSSFAPAQWVRTNGPPSEAIRLATNGTSLLAGTNSGIYTSTDSGNSWVLASTPFGDFSAMVRVDVNLFAGTSRGVFRSSDNGTNWTQVDDGMTDTVVSCLAVSGSNLVAGTGGGIFLSSDNGMSWTSANTGLPETRIACLSAAGTNLFAGADSGVFLSTDNGVTWTERSIGLPDDPFHTLSSWTSIVAIPSAEGVDAVNVFVTGGYDWGMVGVGAGGWMSFGVYSSKDTGASWTEASQGLPWAGPAYCAINCLITNGSALLAGTERGVFLSSNSGMSWTTVSSGLENNTNVLDLAQSSRDLFASAYPGCKVWRRPLSEMVAAVHPSSDELPEEFSLSQNHPNPFNPSTTVRYELPRSSVVRLSVYDILGREVSVLVNERRDAGVHEVKFDASDLTSGMYFYRLQAGDYVQAKKFVVLK